MDGWCVKRIVKIETFKILIWYDIEVSKIFDSYRMLDKDPKEIRHQKAFELLAKFNTLLNVWQKDAEN